MSDVTNHLDAACEGGYCIDRELVTTSRCHGVAHLRASTRSFITLPAIGWVLSLGACTDPVEPLAVSRVAVSPQVVSVVVGQTAQLSAEAFDGDGNVLAGRTVSWSSDAVAVAAVSRTGLVTGVGGGRTMITANVEGESGAAQVTVIPEGCTPTICGQIEDLQAARDIIDYNMNAVGGSSYRTLGIITRWEIPVPVFLASNMPEIDRQRSVDALSYWEMETGIAFEVIAEDQLPRLLIRSGTDGLGPQGGGRGLIDGTYSNNRAQSGLVVIEPGGGDYCDGDSASCEYLFRQEVGHALGYLGHTDAPGVMSAGSNVVSDRERNMMVTLYALPHGAAVNEYGSWRVVVR